MSLSQLIQLAIQHSPNKRIEGRKRLHKLLYLLKLSGEHVPANFRIYHYGPYSPNVADEAGWLSLFGDIEESEEPIGVYGSNQYVYTLPAQHKEIGDPSASFSRKMAILGNYSTIDLEVASTVAYFENDLGYSHDKAIAATKEMKPSKTTPQVMARAENLLKEIAA